jgi:hypothetical protein
LGLGHSKARLIPVALPQALIFSPFGALRDFSQVMSFDDMTKILDSFSQTYV